jgi:hypothetical protein
VTDGWQRYLQAPRTKPAGPIKDAADQENRRKQDEGEATKDDQSAPSADFVALINAIKDEGIAYRKEEQREDRGKRRREWITIILIAFTFAAICWQVHEMVKVYEPIRQQAEAAQKSADAAAQTADAAQSQAEAMTKQAESSVRQAESAAQAIIGSQRAWVGPTNATFGSEPTIGKPIEITILYQNTGREPALSFVWNAAPYGATLTEDANGVVATKLSRSLEFCKNTNTWQGGSVAYPTVGFNTFNLNLKTADDFVDEEITKGDKFIFVEGCFLYRSFDRARHSYFCYFYKQGQTKIQNLNICAIGHYAD